MEEHYLVENTACLKFLVNPDTNSSSIVAKKKQYKTYSFSWMLYLISLFIFLFGININAQTVLISPTGDGGFETGTTFAANGWTEVSGSTTKAWYVGTGQAGYTGNRCAFIGNDAITVGNDISARTVHIYKSITIPVGATNISLSFKYKQAISDYSGSTYYDYITVYTDNSVPTSGSFPGGTLQFGPYPNGAITSFATQNITLPNNLAGTTTNLIFTFKSDAANPIGFGAVDDVSLTYTPSSPPTITNLGSTSGCVGTSITINGTNLTGATAANVKIGGTAVSSIISNNGTVLVAIIGAGTSGTVSVTLGSNTATSTTTFTVNPLPANPANPTSDSPQCSNPGTTLTRSGVPPAGITWYWQTALLGTSTTNSSSTYNVTTTGTYYIRAQNDVTGCWSSGQGSLAVTVNTLPSTLVTVPNPSNAATGVCYSGTGATTSVSWTTAIGATSYDVYFGTTATPPFVANQGTSIFDTGTLAANTTYYWKIIPKNSCGATTGSPVTWSFNTGSTPCYCVPVNSTSCDTNSITNLTFNTINNTSTCAYTNGTSYTNYAILGTPTTNLLIGSSYNLSVTTGSTAIVSAWIDFDQNGTFEASEWVQVQTSGTSGTVNITIPMTALSGNTLIRVRSRNSSSVNASGDSCTAFGSGETEDYLVNLVPPPACVTPTAQPTALILTPPAGGTTINGSFTAAAAVPNNYLVVISTAPTQPTPVNGTTYTIGETVETGGYLVVDTDNNSSFTAIGLSPGTKYYISVFSYNNLCSGGPLYNTTNPLNANATTTTITPSTYCSAATTAANNTLYINDVAFLGTLQDVSNYSTGFSTTPAPTGYHDYTGLATKSKQAQGEGMNVYVGSKSYRGHWKAWVDWNKDGTFNVTNEEVYDSNSVATSTTTFGFVIPPTTAPGDYRIRIRVYNSFRNSNGDENYSLDFSPCETFNSYGNPSYTEYGEAEDYLFTVVSSCSAIIKTVTNGQTCGTGSVALAATGSVGTTSYNWYTSATGGTPIVGATSATYNTPSISTITTYYVTASNGSCESLVRTAVVARINPIPTLNFTPSSPQVCGENTIIDLTASGDVENVYLINENFESGTIGTFTNNYNLSNGTTINNKSKWQVRASTFVPAEMVWFPAISSGFGTNKFAMASSDVGILVENELVSTSVNTSTFTTLTLSFKMYYSSYLDGTDPTNDYVSIQINNGSGWNELTRYTTDVGIGTKFELKTFNLTNASYLNKANLRIKILYHGNWVDGVAADDIQLYGDRPLNTAFNWSGTSLPNTFKDAACTIPYVAGTPVVKVYIKPTLAQLELNSYTFTVNAILSNGCSASTPITVTNNSKIWQNVNTDWNNTSNWKPSGIPTSANCVIIPNTTIIPGSSYNAFAKNLTIKSTGNLELPSTSNLTVTDWVDVNVGGTFSIRDKASLIQINNVANTGIVNIERVTQPISKLDYTYWNSPVTLASNFTLGSLSPNSPLMFSWIPTIANVAGNWQNETTATIMDPKKGYIVRAPNSFSSSSKTPYTAIFNGTPNNGDMTTPIGKGTMIGTVDVDAENDEWNLIGNPYPSALDAAAFLNLPANIPVIDGTLYLWTHNSQPNTATIDPFYGDYVLNYTDSDYAAWNKTGGVGTAGTIAGGLGTNATTGNTPTGYIASGQSFFVKAANSMVNGTTANVTFNNNMRVGVEGKNSDFFKLVKNNKNESIPKSITDIERHRIWINLTNNSGAFSQTLVGYVAGATQELDRSFDGESLGGNDVTFYSIIPEAELTIQGRALPFDENDQVTLGYNSEISGELSIRIDHIDGIFDTQNIYLEDKEMNVIHNLKEKPYVFSTEIGDFNDRFVLRFTDKTLGMDTFSLSKSDEVIVVVNQNVTVQSSNQLIKNIAVYDLLGRKIDSYKKVNTLKYTLSHLNKTTAGLIVKITLDNDTVVSKKIIY